MNVYFMFQFDYCPLIWMNHSRTLNNRINGLHKIALSLVYNDFSSSFSELLEKSKSVTIHHCNLQTLAYEIFKVKKKTSKLDLKIKNRNIKTVTCGSETLSSL